MQTPHFQEKLEALREHIEVVRPEYDLCENKKKRHELLELLETLERDLALTEQPKKSAESWVGRFVTRGGDRVYKVRTAGEEVSLFERMEFLFDPCGWKETG